MKIEKCKKGLYKSEVWVYRIENIISSV